MGEDNKETKVVFEEAAPPKRRNTRFAFACAVLASMTTVVLGYDIGVMSGATIFIQKDLHISDVQVEVLVGIINLYSLIGSIAAGRTSDLIGRRYTIVLAAGIVFAGAILMGFATNYAFLMCGRFVAGVGVGYGVVIAPVYTAEISPASVRGFLTSFSEVFINFGILLGYVSNVAFSHFSLHIGWRLMLGVGAVPAVCLALGVLFMPESPRWLVLQGRLSDAAHVLDRLSATPEEAHLRLSEMKSSAGIPSDATTANTTPFTRTNRGGSGVWKELFLHPTPAVRRVLISAFGIHFFQQASGIDSVVLYSPHVFQKSGLSSNNALLAMTVAVGLTKTSFILVATFLLDRIGRRPLLLASAGGMICSLIGLGIGLTAAEHHEGKLLWAMAVCFSSILAFVAFFSIGLGPMPCVYCSEIFPMRLRAQGAAAGVVVNRVTSGIISMTFLSLYKAISIGGTFFLYAGVAAAGWVFFYGYLRETKGRTLEEMGKLFGFSKEEMEVEDEIVKTKEEGFGEAAAMGAVAAL
ncbi:polyol transporter 5 [Dendrobium catenatum]|uniref:Polyol transporter 5 n=1 Tax=Dendrobium catenatum TaxID=906689 RepID=A0A2I0W6M1_9ASPA|nr:polyol transporter 5 [Dendrobium catenatum]PKU71307.1 Polyol transporter 5 [Dendrobium catenatum]